MPAKKEKKLLLLGKYPLAEAIGLTLDTQFQSSPEFQPLMAELYALSFQTENDLMFKFLESRFMANIIQDREITFRFSLEDSDGNRREIAQAPNGSVDCHQ